MRKVLFCRRLHRHPFCDRPEPDQRSDDLRPGARLLESGLKDRVIPSGARVLAQEIPGGRLAFQARSLRWLWEHAREFDVIISQEVLRGSLNARLAGWIRGTPGIIYMGIAPIEYFRCRKEDIQIGALAGWAGESMIRALMSVNGRLATKCLAMGPYLTAIASQYCPRREIGLYYGVDTTVFRPADAGKRRELRLRRDLPPNRFVILLSSLISDEKDPATVLCARVGRAAAEAMRTQSWDHMAGRTLAVYERHLDGRSAC